MKKILTLAMVLAISCGSCFAWSWGFGKSVKNAVKQDIKNTKNEVKTTNKSIKKAIKSDIANTKKEVKNTNKTIKNAVKQDIENAKAEQTASATAKKNEKIKEINSKLTELNKEMKTVKNSKEITETERTLRTRAIQRQIDFYNKQNAALQ